MTSDRYYVNIDSKHMLSIFAGTELELPYRFQPYLCLSIPFHEYIAFCKEMLDIGVFCMASSKEFYVRALKNKSSPLLLRLYYMDISRAVLSEVILSCAKCVDGTVIIHNNTDAKVNYTLDSVNAVLKSASPDVVQKAVNSIKKDANPNIGFAQISEHNKRLLQYAIILRVLACTLEPDSINISI